jgi:hypothetical protein
MEEYELISKSTPAVEKWGTAYWAMSLRGDSTKMVPVGNAFSGLYTTIGYVNAMPHVSLPPLH